MSQLSAQPAAHLSRSTVSFDVWIAVAFLYPISKLFVVELIGQLYLTDILGVGLLLLMTRSPDFMKRLAHLRVFFLLLGLWLASLVVTDLIRQSVPADFLRGWAKIIFFGIQVAALWLFLPRRKAYIIAFALGSSVAWGLGVSEQFEGYEWKFGYDRAAAFLLIGGICAGAYRWPAIRTFGPVLIALLALFILFQNARSSFITLLLVAGICALVIAVERWPALQARIRVPAFAIILAFGAIGAGLVSSAYGSLAESGALGAGAQYKYEQQTAGDVPLLLGGRSESLISVRAISDSPLIGHGSWAKDRRYVELYRSLRLRLGMSVHDNYFHTRELIPTHSYLLGAWVEAGVMGAVFWLYVLTLPFAAIYQLMRRREILLPLVAYLAVGLVWAIPFSPFGATERFMAAFQIVTLLWVIRSAQGQLLPPRIFNRTLQAA